MGDIKLFTGCWQRLFRQMRSILHLRNVEIFGDLVGPEKSYYMGYPLSSLGSVPREGKCRMQFALEAYLLQRDDRSTIELDPEFYYSELRGGRDNCTSMSDDVSEHPDESIF